jgi:hypothetical protein
LDTEDLTLHIDPYAAAIIRKALSREWKTSLEISQRSSILDGVMSASRWMRILSDKKIVESRPGPGRNSMNWRLTEMGLQLQEQLINKFAKDQES